MINTNLEIEDAILEDYIINKKKEKEDEIFDFFFYLPTFLSKLWLSIL